MRDARQLWFDSGIAEKLAHPPSDSGHPDEWPELFESFSKAIEAAHGEAQDHALKFAAKVIRDCQSSR
jgi:hypothetical protein